MHRNGLTQAETSQTQLDIAARPPSCIAAQRDNANERDALVQSAALGHRKGRAEANLFEHVTARLGRQRPCADHSAPALNQLCEKWRRQREM